jgi:PAS domain S-box-containing protein
VVGVVGAAMALRWGLGSFFGVTNPCITFYPAIAVAALVGGARAGLVATVLSALAMELVFMGPGDSMMMGKLGNWAELVLFGSAGGLISWMAEKVDRMHKQEAEALERKRGEEALRAKEAELELVTNAVPSLIFYLDAEQRYVLCNDTFCVWFGVEREEVLGRTVREFVGEVAWEVIGPKLARAYAGETVEYEVQMPYQRGGMRWIQPIYTPYRDASGRVVGVVVLINDATEQKRAEEALREQAALLHLAHDAIIVFDAGGRITFWNNGAQETYGWTREEARGQVVYELLKTGSPKSRAELSAEMGKKGRWEGELTHTRKDGKEIVVTSRWAAQRNGDGEQIGVLEINRDITERKRVEEALRESEARLRSFYESAPLMMGVVEVAADNSDIIHVYDNPATTRFFGLGSTVGQSALGMGAPEEAVRLWIEHYRMAEREGRPVHFEYWHPQKSGAAWLSAVVARIGRGDSGRMRFSYAVADMTERKRVEEALQISEERLRLATLGGDLGLWDWDIAHDRAHLNGKYYEMTGYEEGEVHPNQAFFEGLVHPEDAARVAGTMTGHLRGSSDYSVIEYRMRRKSGEYRWVRGVGKVVTRDEQGAPLRMAGVIADISAQKENERELETLVLERTAKLQELVEELEHFSYTITHDMRAPLRAMRGFSEMASTLCGDDVRVEAKEALRRISSSAERMDGLITDSLNYSRSVRQELPLTDVDTGALLRGLLDSYPELQPSRANIHVEGRLPVVLGNEAGLTQCFSNLLGNAVKFVRPGEKPRIRVWAEVLADGHQDAWARICVEDKGIGISKQMLPRVFDLFSRGSKSYEGTGVGLALVRKVTQRMGGRAGVDSEEGKGSRFWIEMKLAEARSSAARVKSIGAVPKGGTVLYVEDEESDATFMRVAFERQGMESALRVVGDGQAAIEYLSGVGKYSDREKFPLPSVVLLDLNLPQVPGFEVLKWMRDRPDFARTAVVVFSSSMRDDDRVKALELGANEFVEKPGSATRFGEVVEALKERLAEMQNAECGVEGRV